MAVPWPRHTHTYNRPIAGPRPENDGDNLLPFFLLKLGINTSSFHYGNWRQVPACPPTVPVALAPPACRRPDVLATPIMSRRALSRRLYEVRARRWTTWPNRHDLMVFGELTQTKPRVFVFFRCFLFFLSSVKIRRRLAANIMCTTQISTIVELINFQSGLYLSGGQRGWSTLHAIADPLVQLKNGLGGPF